jgi:polysaccharide pyruvyl transferase WcaK-like protein
MAADAFIDIMGISFTDFSSSWISNILRGIPILIGKLLGKPVVNFTQDMGPFQRKVTRYPAKFFLSKLDLIMARGTTTENYLDGIGITTQIHVRPDSAFILDPAPAERVNVIMLQENLGKRPLVAITPSSQIDKRLSGEDIEAQNKYTVMLARIADYLIETIDALVVFIPNETRGGYDDIYVIKKICSDIKNKSSIQTLTSEYAAEELKGLIGTCDVLIGSRYHSVVAATSMCLPCMVIGWGHKYNEVMKILGLTDFESDFQDITYNQLKAKVARLWRNREKIRAELQSKIPAIKESVMSGGKLVKDILKSSAYT